MTNLGVGAPCWADLWTSDVEASGRFYKEILGWNALAPSAEFGGYFMFANDGQPVAGGMGDMGDMKANNSWKIYMATDNIEKVVDIAKANGATIDAPPMQVADLGSQMVMTDPAGATLGAWQAGTFAGFSSIGTPGTPSWFELNTSNFETSLEFYQQVFGCTSRLMTTSGDARYAVLQDSLGRDCAGVAEIDIAVSENGWRIYFEVEDVDVAVDTVAKVGGSIVEFGSDTEFGRVAEVRDSTGARIKLHSDTRSA